MFDSSIPPLFSTAHASVGLADRQLRRRHQAGELVRLRAGVYVTSQEWKLLDYDARYRARVHAASLKLERSAQFSHNSAVVVWHLPGLGPWPNGVEVNVPRGSHPGTSKDIHRHASGLDPESVQINHATVTSLPRTVIDAARSTTFMRAVCIADAALAVPEDGTFRAIAGIGPAPRDVLASQLDVLASSAPGAARARRVLEFSSGKSGSPGESISRVQFHLLGFPPPELQVPFYDEQGLIGYADFYWPELDFIGEFDGDVKYLGKKYLRGRLPAQVVKDEKDREDRMRRVVRAFDRWDWDVARDQRKLANRLRPHGLIAIR